MSFKQVPGSAQIMAHEDGRLREGLRNLRPDDPRFEYFGEDEWPIVVVMNGFDVDTKRFSAPECVMKAQGQIAPSVVCEPSDFTPKDGNYRNWALKNIEYSPSGNKDERAAKGSPYVAPPKERKEEPKKEEPKAEDLPKADEDAKAAEQHMSPLQKGSGELTAKEAIKIIEDYDFEELRDMGFYTEDDRDRGPRKTVEEAWNDKQSEYEESAG